MADSLTAIFSTQGAAAAAVEKLLARGLPREHVVMRIDESVGNSAASSSAPTTVISGVSHAGPRETERHVLYSRSPFDVTPPDTFGHATVILDIVGDLSADYMLNLLIEAGATSVVHGDVTLPKENPDTSPVVDTGDPEDVEKAIAATRAGEHREK
jgi:hypothetical protein